MSLHRVLTLAAALACTGIVPAAAQFPPPPPLNGQPPAAGQQQQSSPFPTPPGSGNAQPAVQSRPPVAPFSSPFGAGPPPGPAPGPRTSSACDGFLPIRQEAEKGAGAIRAAGDRKATREEVCPLFQRFAVLEGKVLKFLETHIAECGIPPDVVKQAKANHTKTLGIRTAVCSKAPAAAGPSLSDALSGQIDADAPPKLGRGTFDTLTGPVPR